MNHNVVELPSTKAKLLVDEARAAYMKNDRNTARTKLDGAFALKAEVERYNGLVWDYVHDAFTEVMLDMAELWFKLDDCEQGRKLARHAQAWAMIHVVVATSDILSGASNSANKKKCFSGTDDCVGCAHSSSDEV